MTKTTNSQIIKQVLELCEAYGMPPSIIDLIRRKCWNLVKNTEQGQSENEE